MAYDRLSVEFDEEGWVTFCLADRPPAEQSRAEFQPPKGFALDDVLEAARATGWVVDRQGSLWIDPGTTSAHVPMVGVGGLHGGWRTSFARCSITSTPRTGPRSG